jgi:hypothetical protein
MGILFPNLEGWMGEKVIGPFNLRRVSSIPKALLKETFHGLKKN